MQDLYSESVQWGCKYLSSHGYALKNTIPEIVKQTPWSYVVRFVTSEGYIYLKQTPPLLALEVTITQILREQFRASVPKVVAYNPQLHCFLMKDAGHPLRGILKKKFDVGLLCKGIDLFTSIQIAVADHVNIFLDIGVPDWRLNKLPNLFVQFLSQKELLIADGLTEIEIHELESRLPKIFQACKNLSDYPIKQTIIQPDFHDNNLLINPTSHTLTLIDLGEIVVSHPFFSLVNFLHQVKKHHTLKDEEAVYLQLMNAVFKNYIDILSRKDLLEVFTKTQKIWFLYVALAGKRLMEACGNEKLTSFQPGKLSSALKGLIAAFV